MLVRISSTVADLVKEKIQLFELDNNLNLILFYSEEKQINIIVCDKESLENIMKEVKET